MSAWGIDGPTLTGLLIALGGGCGWLIRRHDSRAAARQAEIKAEADKATAAQAAALAAKNEEIGAWERRYERMDAAWEQRYEQERREHREDVARQQERIDRLTDSRAGREPMP